MSIPLFENAVVGRALKPTVVDDSPTITGDAISEPWKLGKFLSLILTAGAMTTNDALTIAVQVQKRSDDSWVAMEGSDGTTDLVFTASKIADTGLIETGVVLGTIDVSKINGATYKAVRITAVNAVTQNVTVAAVYVISGVYDRPTGQADDLYGKQIAAAA